MQLPDYHYLNQNLQKAFLCSGSGTFVGRHFSTTCLPSTVSRSRKNETYVRLKTMTDTQKEAILWKIVTVSAVLVEIISDPIFLEPITNILKTL